jgi:hypothetical protein
MQARVKPTQLGQMREQPFASIERRHAQMQAHDIAGFHLRSTASARCSSFGLTAL